MRIHSLCLVRFTYQMILLELRFVFKSLPLSLCPGIDASNKNNLLILPSTRLNCISLRVSNCYSFTSFYFSLPPSSSPSLFQSVLLSTHRTQQNSHNFYIIRILCKFWLQIIERFKSHCKIIRDRRKLLSILTQYDELGCLLAIPNMRLIIYYENESNRM